MKRLPTETKKHGSRYVLHKRTEQVAMYYVYGSKSSPDRVTNIEVFEIPVREPDEFCKYYREVIVPDSQFGVRNESKAFGGVNKFEESETHYQTLNKRRMAVINGKQVA